MAAGELHVPSCLKMSWFLRSFLVFFLYDFKAALKMPSILEEDSEGVVAGAWGIEAGAESNLAAISTTGLGNDPMTVIGHALASCENDGQTDTARKSTDNDVETRVVAFHDRDVQVCPVDSALALLLLPPDAPRLRIPVWPIKDAPLPPLHKLIRPNLTPANATPELDDLGLVHVPQVAPDPVLAARDSVGRRRRQKKWCVGVGTDGAQWQYAPRRLVEETRAEAPCDRASVKVVLSLPTKRACTHARAQAVSSQNDDRLPVSSHGKGKCHPHTPISPRRKRQRMADDSDKEIEIIVDTPRELGRVPKAKPQSQPSGRPQPRHRPRATHQRPYQTWPQYSRPYLFTRPRSRIYRPAATILANHTPGHELARGPSADYPSRICTHGDRDPCACTRSPALSLGPPDPVRKLQQMQQHVIRKGFCYGGRGRESGSHLDLDISILGDGPADAHGIVDDDVFPHSSAATHRGYSFHNHPDRPILGFVTPDHDDVDYNPGAAGVGRAHTSPGKRHVVGGAGASTDTGTGDAGDGTIDPSVLSGGGNNSLSKLGDGTSSPTHEFGNDDAALGKGKGRAAVVDGIVESFLPLLVRRCEEELAQITCGRTASDDDVEATRTKVPELTSDCSAEAFERPACRDYRNCTLCSWMRKETWPNWVACRGCSNCPVRTPTSKSKSKNKNPRAAQVPAPTTMTDTRVEEPATAKTPGGTSGFDSGELRGVLGGAGAEKQ
ncbi:hypothetical protein EDB86DRAFT_2834016 [Lactarius hatsudake]|nr:hypothetical protein EDB86DRAFT_2834016 [Lactarius hatsudake]